MKSRKNNTNKYSFNIAKLPITFFNQLIDADKLSIRLVNQASKEAVRESISFPYKSKMELFVGIDYLFYDKTLFNCAVQTYQSMCINEVRFNANMDIFSSSWKTYLDTINSTSHKSAILYKLTDIESFETCGAFAKFSDGEDITLEGRRYSFDENAGHTWINNQLWLLAQFHQNRSFMIYSELSDAHIMCRKYPGAYSALAREIGTAVKAGYQVNLKTYCNGSYSNFDNPIELIPNDEDNLKQLALNEIDVTDEDINYGINLVRKAINYQGKKNALDDHLISSFIESIKELFNMDNFKNFTLSTIENILMIQNSYEINVIPIPDDFFQKDKSADTIIRLENLIRALKQASISPNLELSTLSPQLQDILTLQQTLNESINNAFLKELVLLKEDRLRGYDHAKDIVEEIQTILFDEVSKYSPNELAHYLEQFPLSDLIEDKISYLISYAKNFSINIGELFNHMIDTFNKASIDGIPQLDRVPEPKQTIKLSNDVQSSSMSLASLINSIDCNGINDKDVLRAIEDRKNILVAAIEKSAYLVNVQQNEVAQAASTQNDDDCNAFMKNTNSNM